MRIFLPKYSMPLPPNTNIVTSGEGEDKGKRFAKFVDRKGHTKTALLTKDGKRILRPTKYWYIDFSDHKGKRHKVRAFEDEKASNCLMEDIHMHVAYKMSGAKSELPNDWIKALPPKIFDSLVNVGLLDGDDTASLRPLEKHIGDYMNALQARSLTHSHINTTINSITKIVDGCEYYSWYDITKEPDKIEQYLNELCVSKSASISNCYLKAIKQFANWMIANNRATKSPVVHLMPARKIRKYAENSKMDEAKEMPKVFCGQCKHLIEGRKCEHPQNKRTKHNWKHEYISLKEPPNHINKNNDCSWFEQC